MAVEAPPLAAAATSGATSGAVSDLPRAALPTGSPSIWHRLLLVFIGLVMAASLTWWVSKSPVFQMNSLRVQGERHLGAGEVGRLAGLTSHTSVLWLSTSTVARRLEASAWIRSATVARSLPGSVTIDLVERTPAGVAIIDGRRDLVSSDGVVLGQATARAARRLPEIQVQARGVRAGTRLAPVPATVAAVGALPAAVRELVVWSGLAPDGSVQLRLRSGATVEFGDGANISEKARVLASILGWARRHGTHPAVIDVRAPDAPALLPVGQAVASG